MFLKYVLKIFTFYLYCNYQTYILGGTGVSIPSPRCYSKLHEELLKCIEEGKYVLGELIEPKTYTKVVLDSNDELNLKTFTVHGRIPLDEICERIFHEHQELGIFEIEL